MTRTRTGVVSAAFFLLAAAVALTLVLLAGKSSGSVPGFTSKAGGEAGEVGNENAAEVVREGPTSFEQWRAASRTYPAKAIPTKVVARAQATFNRIAARDVTRLKHARRLLIDGHKWKLYGPTENATEPGVISFSGATNDTASRVTTMVADPDCNANHCRLWAGVSGGGVWRTDNATAPEPGVEADQPRRARPELGRDADARARTARATTARTRSTSAPVRRTAVVRLRVGRGHLPLEGRRRSLAEARGQVRQQREYPCVTPGIDAFLGRGINSIVIDPRNSSHILVGSALGVRGLSHVIGAGGTSRFEPGANQPGLYESIDGGATFKEVWDGTKPDAGISFGITDVGLDPLNPDVVYASGFDAGVWRRDAGAAATAFQQVFKPAVQHRGRNRPHDVRAHRKNGNTRIYLTDGTAAGGGPATRSPPTSGGPTTASCRPRRCLRRSRRAPVARAALRPTRRRTRSPRPTRRAGSA